MRFIRDRADARLLPARYRFALSRLVAWIRLLSAPPRHQKGLAIAIDRDQTAIEHHVAGWGTTVITAIYLAALFARQMNGLLAALSALLLAPLVVQLPMFAVGGFLSAVGHGQTTSRWNSAATFAALFLASVYFASTSGLPRVVACGFLMLIGLNAIVAGFLWIVRDRVAESERRFMA